MFRKRLSVHSLRAQQSHNHKRRLFREQLEDRRLLAVELVSVTPPPALTAGSEYSTNPAISANGRYVAFQSHADDLVAVDTNGTEDVFVRDLVTGTTSLISINAAGTDSAACPGVVGCSTGSGNGSYNPAISDDGRFVTFLSRATDLTGDTIDVTPNVFVRDRDADADGILDETGPGESRTTLLSISIDGTAAGTISAGSGPGPSQGPVISGTGTSVAFVSRASDIPLDDPTLTDFNGGDDDVFLANLVTGGISLVSVNGLGTGSSPTSGTIDGLSTSGTGVVAFASSHSGLISAAAGSVDDTNGGLRDIFVGGGSGPVTLVSMNSAGTGTGNAASREPVISRNGRHVAFFSAATDLVGATDTNLSEDLFVRDLKTEITTLVSRSRAVPGSFATGNAGTPFSTLLASEMSISDDGRFIAFRSGASDLLDPALGVVDANAAGDVFRYDRDPDRDGVFDEPGETAMVLVSVNAAGTASTLHTDVGVGAAASSVPSISRDGRYVAFASTGRDLIPGGTPLPSGHVYIRDMLTGVTALVDVVGAGAGPSFSPPGTTPLAFSRDGTRVAFQSSTDASALDATVTDPPNSIPVSFGENDVFAGTPGTDIRLTRNFANGTTTHAQAFRILFDDALPFDMGYYSSTDDLFDAGDELLGMTAIDDIDDLTVDGNRFVTVSIGAGTGEVALPGVAAADVDEDYFVLTVGDHLDTVPEFDADPFNEDNTRALRGLYHLPSGPVFVHGGAGGETMTATSDGTTLTFSFGATGFGVPGTFKYDVADVSEVRVRSHGGDDVVTGSDLVDVIFGGEGSDTLDGGAGDDVINGGPGADTILGGPGADTIFDGPGDDLVDVGDDDDIVIATPGSGDVFIDTGGDDTLDFSLASLPITLDLDSTAVQKVDSAGNTIRLVGTWENFIGTPFDDSSTVLVKPLSVPRSLDGGAGVDRLVFNAMGRPVTFDGTTFQVQDYAPVTVSNFEEIVTVNAAGRKIDDDEPGYSDTGFSASDPNFPQGHNDDVKFSAAGAGNTATWNFTNVAPGFYYVAGTWTHAPDRAKDAPFTIRDGGPTDPIVDQIRVNQEQAPAEFLDQGIFWRNLGLFQITGHEFTVQLSDDADEFVVADAVSITTTCNCSSPGEQRILDALNEETEFDFLDTPLQDAVDEISFQHNIPIVLDEGALADAGIPTNVPVTRTLSGITLRSALRLLLEDLELTYIIKDEVLQITTLEEEANAQLVTKVYPVGDLVVPIQPGIVDDSSNQSPGSVLKAIHRATGTDAASIQTAVDAFRAELGGVDNGNALGSQGNGRREVNWDDVDDADAAPNAFPGDFYNSTVPRGLHLHTDGTGLQVSADSDNPTSTGIRFENLNNTYNTAFSAFSAERLFTPVGDNVTDVRFFVPGSNQPASVSGFGAVFTDVDDQFRTRIEFFDPAGNLLLQRTADPTPGDGSLSFLGVAFEDAPIGRVRITGGTAAVGVDDITQGGGDIVVLDDFIYGEPIPLADPIASAGFSSNCSAITGPGLFGDRHTCDVLGETAEWDFAHISPIRNGTYAVSATWTPAASLSDDTRYTIDHDGQQIEVGVNQQVAPDDFVDGGNLWERIAKITIDNGQPPVVTASDPLGGVFVADAVRIDPSPTVELLDPLGNVVTNGGIVDLGQTAIDPDTGLATIANRFTVVNTGSSPLLLDNLTATGTGFSVSDFGVDIPPGDTTFEVELLSNSLGQFDGQIFLDTNDIANPVFTFNATVQVVDDVVPPTVQISSPVDDDSIIEASTITIQVDASDDIGVKSVDLLVDGQTMGTDTEFPFEFPFTLPALNGPTVEIRAVARDIAGNTANADPITINVLDDQPPTVSILSPVDGSDVVEGQTINIFVDATDDVGVVGVDFLVNGTVVDTSTIDPFIGQFVVPVGASQLDLTARAFDTAGNETVSLPVTLGGLPDAAVILPPGGDFELFVDGDKLTVRRQGGAQVQRLPLNVPGVMIFGADHVNDSLTIDLTGLPPLPNGIRFDGGVGGFDSLAIKGGGTFDTATHRLDGADNGRIEYQRGTTTTITYTGLEPIFDNVSADDRVFTVTAPGGQTIRLIDDGEPRNGMTTIDSDGSGGFESVTFASPSKSITVEAGDGSDTITVVSVDERFTGGLKLDGGTDGDILDASAAQLRVILVGGPGSDTLTGGMKSDLFMGLDSEADTLNGGAEDFAPISGLDFDPGLDTLNGFSASTLSPNGIDRRHLRLAVTATEEYTDFFGTREDAKAAIEKTVAAVNKVFNRELNLQLDLIENMDIIFGPGNSPDPFPSGGPGFAANQMLLDDPSVLGSGNYDVGIVFGGIPVGVAFAAGAGIDGDKAKAFTGFTPEEGGPAGANAIGNALHEMGHQLAALHTFNGVLGTCGGSGQRNAATAFEPGGGTTLVAYAGICGGGSPSGGDNVQGNNDPYYHAGSLDQIIDHLEMLDGLGVGTKDLGINNAPRVAAGAGFTIPAGTPFQVTASGFDADDPSGDSLRYTIEQMDVGPAQTLDPFAGDNGSSPLFRSFPPAPAQNGSFTRVFPQLSDILTGTETKGEYLPTTTRELNFRATVRDGVGGTSGDDVTLSVIDTGSPFAVTSPNSATTLTGGTTTTVTWDVAGTTGGGIDTPLVNIRLSTDGGLTFPHLLANTDNDGSHPITVPNFDTASARIKIEGDGNIFFDISDVDFTIIRDPAAAGVTVTDGVFVGEGGDFSPETDTYTLALNTSPASSVEITVSADGDTEVSTDGTTFASTVAFTRSDTSPQTITVRAIDDSASEGAERHALEHSITSSTDPAYPLDLVIDEIVAEVADNEQPPLIAVDMQVTGLPVPRNWTEIDDDPSLFFEATFEDLIREDGLPTGVDLTLDPDDSGSFVHTMLQVSPLTAPIHTPSLSDVGGAVHYLDFGTGPFTVNTTWSGLTPSKRYNVYVFAMEGAGINSSSELVTIHQTVTITGDGSDDPAPFVQDSTGRTRQLLINDEEGDDTRTLESFAKTVTANSSGEINIEFIRDDSVDMNRIVISALAIQEEPPEPSLLPTVEFTSAIQSGAEDIATITVTATLSEMAASDVSVPFTISGTATEGASADYTVTSSPLLIPAGSTTADITITVNDDLLDELDETVIVTMGTPLGATKGSTDVHTATIVDNDPTPTVEFTSMSQSAAEDVGTMTVTAMLSAPSDLDVVVPFTVSGTATLGLADDFTVTASPITILAGFSTADITITVNNDPDNEPDETVIVTMGTPTNALLGTISEHTATIEDNDVPAITAVLDVTGNGMANPFQDGIIIVRFMLDQPDQNLGDPLLIPTDATRTTGAEIRAFLEAAGDAFDVNGDGNVNPFEDGILIVRFLLDQPDENLEDTILIPEGSTRTTGAEIRAYLQTLLPPASEGEFVPTSRSGEGESIIPSVVNHVGSADVNGDGSVTMRDVLNVINAMDRGKSSDEPAWTTLDANRDGRVNAADAVFVIKRLHADAVMSEIEDESSDAVDRLLSDEAFVNGLF